VQGEIGGAFEVLKDLDQSVKVGLTGGRSKTSDYANGERNVWSGKRDMEEFPDATTIVGD
jgi:hypothetical protein